VPETDPGRRVVVDVDDTLARTAAAFCERVNDRHGCALTPADLDLTDRSQRIPGTDEPLLGEVVAASTDPEFVGSLDPLPGAVDALAALADAGLSVDVVTRRPDGVREATADWLAERGFVYDSLRCGVGPERAETEAAALVDDRPDVVRAVAAAGTDTTPILVRRPYNADADLPAAVRTPGEDADGDGRGRGWAAIREAVLAATTGCE
jgi:5'(3')-deoxyribonucleotidase